MPMRTNLDLETVTGSVSVKGVDGDLEIESVNASNQNPNPHVDVDRGGRRRIEVNNAICGSINGGGPDFEMRTFNGNVYVRKGK